MTEEEGRDRRQRQDPPSWAPVPDPTSLTTAALYREVNSLQELIEQQISALEALVEEKFISVAKQFTLVEGQRVEQKLDTKQAVDAALAAAKEAVKEQTAAFATATTKSENAIKEQLAQITVTFNAALGGLITQVGDMKERVSKIENVKVGGSEMKGGLYALAAFILTLIVIGSAVAAVAAGGKG